MAPTIAPTIHHREPTSRAARHATRRRSRRGLTLVEMMVSVTITLLVVFAIVQIFDIMGNTVAMGRATIEMAGQLRSVSNTLQQDLDNLTCPVEPWIDPDAGVGYFEYIEGPRLVNLYGASELLSRSSDRDGLANSKNNSTSQSVFGDVDDVLAMTVRSDGEPFVGRAPDATGNEISVESNVAEVIWWIALYDTNGNNVPDLSDSPILLRRQLLVRPDLDLGTAPDHRRFFFDFDISAHFDGMQMQPNSLADLTERSKRFAHQYDPSASPFEWPHDIAVYVPDDDSNPQTTADDVLVDEIDNEIFLFEHEQPRSIYLTTTVQNSFTSPDTADTNNYEMYSSVLPRFITQQGLQTMSSFVVLTDVSGFDVRAFDPTAIGFILGNTALQPGDPEYAGPIVVKRQGQPNEHAGAQWVSASNSTAAQRFQGCFVDLGHLQLENANGFTVPAGFTGVFGDAPVPPTSADPEWNYILYDTWSLSYERDGIDQNDDGSVDEGFDGIDNPDDEPPGLPINGVDDLTERETSPPYDEELQGIEVRIRMLEFGTGQVRQVSVVGDFTK